MSASLVGSEMCIRDRVHSEPVEDERLRARVVNLLNEWPAPRRLEDSRLNNAIAALLWATGTHRS
eukprot:6243362-Alexandrium_andersonii.AAC.1